MRVTTSITWNMSTGEVLEHEWFEYSGTVALCKGDNTIKQSELQQMQFSSRLMDIFNKQFADQRNVLMFLQDKLKPQIEKPTGYGDSAKAAMRAEAVDTISSQYDNATKALQNQQFALGGRDLPSGVNAMQVGALKGAQARDTAGALNTIELNDENLKQNNYWNAIDVLSGNVANQFNPLGYAGANANAANNVGSLGMAYKKSRESQLVGALGGIAGGAATAATKALFGQGG